MTSQTTVLPIGAAAPPDGASTGGFGPSDGPPPSMRGGRGLSAPLVVALVAVVLGLGAVAGILIAVTSGNGSSNNPANAANVAPAAEETTTTETEETVTTSTESSETETTTEATPADSPGQPALEVVNQHWKDIEEGNYHGAWEDESPQLRGEESTWVKGQEEARVQNVSYQFRVGSVSGNRAEIVITKLQTHDAKYGCKNWSGSYTMAESGSEWQISEAHLTSNGC